MEHVAIKKAKLKRISEERQIPFSNLLAEYMLEEIFFLFCDSDFSENIWIKNDYIFQKEDYVNRQYYSLELVYHVDEKANRKEKITPGQVLSKELVEYMLSNVFVKEKTKWIRFKWKYQLENEGLGVDIQAEYEEMTVPIHVEIESIYNQMVIPEKKEVNSMIRSGEKLVYRHYPIEAILVEELFKIVQYMELIPSMETYHMVYTIISRELLQGLHIRETFLGVCEKNGFTCDEKRGQTIIGYKNYAYMRKKWDKYAKNYDITWEQVMEKIEKFFLPIWNSICRDEVFFGDWMPELGRYLD